MTLAFDAAVRSIVAWANASRCPKCGSALIGCYPDPSILRCSNWPRCRWMGGLP